MLKMSDGYKEAIVGDAREMFLKATLEIVDPDMEYTAASSSAAAPFSKINQLHDKNTDLDSLYATLEPGRWVLDGTRRLIPNNPADLNGQIGFVSNSLCDASGVFSPAEHAEICFRNVSILQALSVFFPADKLDGVAENFTVSVISNGAEIYKKDFVGNKSASVTVSGFTVYNPDKIRVTVTKWSVPYRRVRIAEIIPGVYEKWTENSFASIDIQQHGTFSCLSIPYNTCTFTIDNLDRRFEPRNKSGVFQSIEDRQGIPVAIGVKTKDGRVEYANVGVFYQYSGGWRTSDNDMTMRWDLVDIIGLISDREYIPPAKLPTTLGGWLESLVSQLGKNFVKKWNTDPAYINKPCVVKAAADVQGKKCGDILRYACMATGTWPRADGNTGDLTAEPFWNEGGKLDLDNLNKYPTMIANDDLAVLTFKLYDGNETIYNISGNATSSSKTLSVDNPFIHTKAEALTAAKQILSQYGGLKLDTVGRGNPASEIGDVDTVWLDESSATTGRRMDQSFSFSDGFLTECKSVLLQADGSFMFQNREAITKSGVWNPPAGVSEVRVVIGQGGQGGQDGPDGKDINTGGMRNPGKQDNGEDGLGGKIWAGVVKINPGQPVEIVIGKGSENVPARKPKIDGGETFFGAYSSQPGKRYPLGYTDIASGDSYGRSGVESPVNGSADGAKGGEGGFDGSHHFDHWEPIYNAKGEVVGKRAVYVDDSSPTRGTKSTRGADGFVVVYWEKG